VNDLVPLIHAALDMRDADAPPANVYYYAAFAPAATLSGYCRSGSGCVTGTTPIGLPVSVGVGFTGDASAGTLAHEVGHAHGLKHAPCGTTDDVDPNFPDPQGTIGSWGYDSLQKVLIDPTNHADMMGYCDPEWISDYDYQALFNHRITVGAP
jgi:hypothetical protein